MFYHGYDNYMKHAFPEDEIRPISCTPLTRDQDNPAHIELNDALGNYSLTLIDSLSTLAILTSSPTKFRGKNKALAHFKSGVRALVEQYGDGSEGSQSVGKRCQGFDVDSKVQVFETVIRGVGGLLSAHLFAIGDLPMLGYEPRAQKKTQLSVSGAVSSVRWSRSFTYDGQLLRLAQDLARRLLPAFDTPTGLPYPRVNLRHGIPFYLNSPLNQDAESGQCPTTQQEAPAELTETCSAGAGSLILEFTTLSRLTGDSQFEKVAKRAFWSVWDRKSAIGLVGAGIDAESGHWMTSYTGIGASIDSFYEYAAKGSILLSSSSAMNGSSPSAERDTADAFRNVWHEAHAAIKRHLYRGDQYTHPHYIQADLYTGAARAFWFDSLSAFYPGLLAAMGELEEATATHLLMTALWTRYSALPERWSAHHGGIEGGLGWWGGRPEFIESTYHLYRATQDPWYLHVGEMVLRDIKRRCWARCGWAGIQDVRSGDRNDRMESFFLGETTKYLYLLFEPDHILNRLDTPYVFSTEGHPLILPRQNASSRGRKESRLDKRGEVAPTCPRAPDPLPLTFSVTAARKDVFHAAKLTRLHMMPMPQSVESSLVDFSRDHPSITLSDVQSPSNYTFYPWTLPQELVPPNGVSSKISARPTFDITFPPAPNTIIGPGFLQRVSNGILINSMGGVRLGMIQDVPAEPDSGELYRIQAINNVVLGKDERIFVAKDTASSIVNPLDPNFTRVRDPVMLDLAVDLEPVESVFTTTSLTSNTTASLTLDASITGEAEDNAHQSMQDVFSALIQQVAVLMGNSAPTPSPTASAVKYAREYFPAVLPMGPGAAPLPDIEEALGPDIHGGPQGTLIWNSVFVTDECCDSRLAASVPRDTQVIVMKRGTCSFSQKLQNIPLFVPAAKSLQLVIVVSFEKDDETLGEPAGWLVRPYLESTQKTSSGLVRRHPIPLIMVAGGDSTYEILSQATGIGIKRRYSIQAQGIPISNLVIL